MDKTARSSLSGWTKRLVDTIEYSDYSECDFCFSHKKVSGASFSNELSMFGMNMPMLWVKYESCCGSNDGQVPFSPDTLSKLFIRKLLKR